MDWQGIWQDYWNSAATVFNPDTAQNWYATQATSAYGRGNWVGGVLDVLADAGGGFIGGVKTPGQAWAGIALAMLPVPSVGKATLALRVAAKEIGVVTGVSSYVQNLARALLHPGSEGHPVQALFGAVALGPTHSSLNPTQR